MLNFKYTVQPHQNTILFYFCGRDHIIVGFTTTCAINAYHHSKCEFRIPLRRCVLDTALCDKVVNDLRQVGGILRVLQFPPPIKLTTMI
jgi:hypothetical protein